MHATYCGTDPGSTISLTDFQIFERELLTCSGLPTRSFRCLDTLSTSHLGSLPSAGVHIMALPPQLPPPPCHILWNLLYFPFLNPPPTSLKLLLRFSIFSGTKEVPWHSTASSVLSITVFSVPITKKELKERRWMKSEWRGKTKVRDRVSLETREDAHRNPRGSNSDEECLAMGQCLRKKTEAKSSSTMEPGQAEGIRGCMEKPAALCRAASLTGEGRGPQGRGTWETGWQDRTREAQ